MANEQPAPSAPPAPSPPPGPPPPPDPPPSEAQDPGPGSGSSPASGACPDAAAGPDARMASRLAARDTPGRRAAARPAREGALGSAATPTGAGSERVDQGDPAPNLAERTAQPPSTAHHSPDAGAVAGVGSAQAPTGALPGRRLHEARGIPAAADACVPSRCVAWRQRDRCTRCDRLNRCDGLTDAAARPYGTAASKREDADAERRRSGRVSALSPLHPSAGTLGPARLARRVVPPVVVELGRLVAVMYRIGQVGRSPTDLHPVHGGSAAARLPTWPAGDSSSSAGTIASPLEGSKDEARSRRTDHRQSRLPRDGDGNVVVPGRRWRRLPPGRSHAFATRRAANRRCRTRRGRAQCRGSSSATTEFCTRHVERVYPSWRTTWRKCKE